MAIDWDGELLAPVMAVFGEGSADDPSSWPIYYPVAGGRLPLPGAVFDEQYQRVVELEDGASSSSTHPVLGVRDALFALYPNEPQQGAGVLIPSVGKTYRINRPEADGHGHTLLILIEANL